MRAATTVLHREHDAIVMGLRVLAEIDRQVQEVVEHLLPEHAQGRHWLARMRRSI